MKNLQNAIENNSCGVRDLIFSKMRIEEMKDLSNNEIERVFGGCVTGKKIIKAIKNAIDLGMLYEKDNRIYWYANKNNPIK